MSLGRTAKLCHGLYNSFAGFLILELYISCADQLASLSKRQEELIGSGFTK